MSGKTSTLHVTVSSPDGISKMSLSGGKRLTVGRTPECSLVLQNSNISRLHMSVYEKDGETWVEDHGSSNGTFINGDRIKANVPRILKPSEEVKLGKSGYSLYVLLEMETVPLNTPEDPQTIPLAQTPGTEEPHPQVMTPLKAPEPLFDSVLKPMPEKEKLPFSVPKKIFETPKAVPAATPAKTSTAGVETIIKPKAAVSVNPAPAVSTPASFQAPAPAMPEPKPQIVEAERILQEARQQAARIVRDAEVAAEKKTQEVYERAQETQRKAEESYKKHLQSAYREADIVHAKNREDGKRFIQEAREQAQTLRDDAERFARELREKAEKDCDTILSEAQERARVLHDGRLAEAEELIRQKEDEVLRAAREAVANEEKTLHTRLQSTRLDLEDVQKRRADVERELGDLRSQTEAEKKKHQEMLENHRQERAELNDVKNRIQELQKEKDKAAKELDDWQGKVTSRQQDFERAGVQLTAVREQLQQADKEFENRQSQLKAKLQESRAEMAKDEEDRLHQLQLETTRRVEKLEKELMDDLQRRRETVEKEILLAVDLALKASPPVSGENWAQNSPTLHHDISLILSGQPATLKQGSKAKDTRKKLNAGRRREQWTFVASGVALGAMLLWAGQVALIKLNTDTSPLTRRLASEAEERAKDLERRKFNPPQVAEVKDNYTDAVIYTRDFARLYLDESYQQKWYKAATAYLFKTWRLDEDRSLQVLSASTALVRNLVERKEKIHPDFVKETLQKMRDQEKETLQRLRELLGSQVRFESFKKYEAQFFKEYIPKR